MKIKRTAYHESGHAIMSFFLKIPIKKITIIPNKKYGGCVTNKFPKDINSIGWDNKYKKLIEKHIMVLMSGHIAEKIFFKRVGRRSVSDDHSISDLITHIYSEPKVINAYLKYLNILATTMMESEQFKPVVKELAKILLKKKELKGKECKNTIYEIMNNQMREWRNLRTQKRKNSIK